MTASSIPGVKGDFIWTKHWDAVPSKIVVQTGMFCQQVVSCWHDAVASGIIYVCNNMF